MSLQLRQVLLTALVSAVTTTLVIILFGLTLLAFWGKGQCVSLELMQQKLVQGMTPQETAFALAMSTDELLSKLKTNDVGESYVDLAEDGIGSYFVPQYQIALVFDRGNRLQRGGAKLISGIDDLQLPFEIRANPHAD